MIWCKCPDWNCSLFVLLSLCDSTIQCTAQQWIQEMDQPYAIPIFLSAGSSTFMCRIIFSFFFFSCSLVEPRHFDCSAMSHFVQIDDTQGLPWWEELLLEIYVYIVVYGTPLVLLTTAVINSVLLWRRKNKRAFVAFVVFCVAAIASFFLLRLLGKKDLSLLLAALYLVVFACVTFAISRKLFFITALIYCAIAAPVALYLHKHPLAIPWKHCYIYLHQSKCYYTTFQSQ